MNYTKLKDIATLNDKDIVEAIAATIAFVGDPETTPSKATGKPTTKQSLKLTASDGTEIWADNYAESCFMDRSKKGSKVIIASTVKDGKMQGINVNKWNDKVGLRLFGGTNFTFPEAQQPTQQQPSQPQPQQHSQQQQTQPQRQQSQSNCSPTSLTSFVDMWLEIYGRIQPVVQNDTATAATTTIFIEANKRNIGPTLTQPAAAIASFAPTARKIADEVLAKGGYDMDKLPSGDDLDAIVDLLIDKASETVSRERIGTAFDAFVKQRGGDRNDAVRMLVADWAMFLGGLK
jgi:hypothetical protein